MRFRRKLPLVYRYVRIMVTKDIAYENSGDPASVLYAMALPPGPLSRRLTEVNISGGQKILCLPGNEGFGEIAHCFWDEGSDVGWPKIESLPSARSKAQTRGPEGRDELLARYLGLTPFVDTPQVRIEETTISVPYTVNVSTVTAVIVARGESQHKIPEVSCLILFSVSADYACLSSANLRRPTFKETNEHRTLFIICL